MKNTALTILICVILSLGATSINEFVSVKPVKPKSVIAKLCPHGDGAPAFIVDNVKQGYQLQSTSGCYFGLLIVMVKY